MKKFISFLLLLTLILPSGCKRRDTDPVDPGSGPDSKTEKTVIVVYNLFDNEDAFRGQIQAYESEHSNVDIVYKKFHDPAEYRLLLLNELAEGRGPDIFAIRNDWLPSFQKKLTPAPATIFVPETYYETFFGVATDDLVSPDEDGFEQVWGVPLFIDTLAIYYNKQLFRDNLPSTNKPGGTWQEIAEQAFALTKTDNSVERFSLSGIALGHAVNISYFEDIFSLLLIQLNATLFDEGENRTVFGQSQGVSEGDGRPYFPVKEALKLYTSYANPTSQNSSWNLKITGFYPDMKEVGVFARGKTAMIFGFSTTYGDIQVAIESLSKSGEKTILLEDIGTAPAPQFSGTEEEGRHDAFAKYYPFVVSRNSANGDAAWEFLQYLSSADSLQVYHEKTKKPSSRQDMIEEQSTEKIYGVFAMQAPYSKSLRTIDPYSFFLIFGSLIDDIVKSKISVDEAVLKADREMKCILEKRNDPTIDEDCFSL